MGYGAVESGGQFEGVDQGIDFTGHGQVYAAEPGTITRIASGTGWPGRGTVFSYKLDQPLPMGPGAGQAIYVAEDFVPLARFQVGQHVQKGELLGTFDSSWPGIEMGWSDLGGHAIVPVPPKGQPTWAGTNFLHFVEQLSAGGTPHPPSPGVGGGGVPVGGDFPYAPQPSKSRDNLITGALKEAFIRFLEIGLGLFLLYLGLRGLAKAGRVQTVKVLR